MTNAQDQSDKRYERRSAHLETIPGGVQWGLLLEIGNQFENGLSSEFRCSLVLEIRNLLLILGSR